MPRDTDVSNGSRLSANGARNSRRDASLDIAKGIGILLVVVGHCLDGLKASNFYPSFMQWPTLAVYTIYLFHMPLFFVISGHLASGRVRPALATITKLLPTIVYPYFLWSIVEGFLLYYLTRYTNSHFQLSSLLKIFWVPIVPYWFLYSLFFCQAGYLAVRRLRPGVQLVIALILFGLTLAFERQISDQHLQILLLTTRGFLFFTLGVISVAQVKQLGSWAAIAATVLFIGFATVFYQSQWGGIKGAFAVLPAVIAGVVATLAWSKLLASRDNPVSSMLAFWGRYSMSIYVMHIFFTAGVRIALNRLGMKPDVWGSLLEIGAATAAGIGIPLAVNRVLAQFSLEPWFGLQTMERVPQP